MLKQYKCLVHTTSGKRGQIIQRHNDEQRTAQLLDRGIIEEVKQEEKPANKMAKKPANKSKKADK